MHTIVRSVALLALAVLIPASQALAGGGYVQTNLVSNQPGVAQVTDPNLINPWGISFSGGSPLWVSNQGVGNQATATTTGLRSPRIQRRPHGRGRHGADRGDPEPRRRGAERRQRADGPGQYVRARDRHRSLGLPPQRQQGGVHLRQPGRLGLGVEWGRQRDDHGVHHRRLVHRAGDRQLQWCRVPLRRRPEQSQRRHLQQQVADDRPLHRPESAIRLHGVQRAEHQRHPLRHLREPEQPHRRLRGRVQHGRHLDLAPDQRRVGDPSPDALGGGHRARATGASSAATCSSGTTTATGRSMPIRPAGPGWARSRSATGRCSARASCGA